MARGTTQRRGERSSGEGGGEPLIVTRDCEALRPLTALVRVAMGRLGARISPWLDEGLLMSQGLVTVLELADGRTGELTPESDVMGRVVGGMRAWALSSSWFEAAWPCRIAPLCSALSECCPDVSEDREVARALGLDEGRLAERFAEAGLVFGVSPELLLPGRPHEGGGGALVGAVSALPEDQRRLLTLYFEDGLSFPEIAALLQITPGRAQEFYGRAAASIRARIAGRLRAGAGG
ncbi:MAG: sigma factor-like helix-turn-helix DNA-binding protein [Armatimonadota bacterium]|jgi:hypothetical protein